MALKNDVVNNQPVFIFHPAIGWVHAWAKEEKLEVDLGSSASLRVAVDSANLRGVSEMVIDTNEWDVYDRENLEGLKRIAIAFVKRQYER